MARCENCGNEYTKTFEVRWNGDTHVFDCFECAIRSLAPECFKCGTPIVGHGVESAGRVFCSVSCVRRDGHQELRDHA